MKNKIVLIILGYFIILITGLISCTKCGENSQSLRVKGLELNVNNAVYSDTAQIKLNLSEIINDTVPFNFYSIDMELIRELYFASIQKNNSFGLINSAYACSQGSAYMTDKIKNIVVISNKDFDSTHLAGTNLSELFDVVAGDNERGLERFKLNDLINANPIVPRLMTLVLNTPPNITTNFEFTVKYYLYGNGTNYFESKTRNIVIEN